jgi:hypothetical protein
MKNITQLTVTGCIAAALFVSAADAFGKKKDTASPGASASPAASAAQPLASPSASPGTKMVRVTPFHGMVAAVDSTAKTFTIVGKNKSRVFKISENTVITKAGAPAKMKDIVGKEEVRGSYWKEADGTLQAKTVKVGPLTAEEKAAKEARKAKRAEKKAAKAAAADSASPAASASPKP